MTAPAGTAPAGIVWLASFPKSGNTWFRIFLANLAAGESGPADINDLDGGGGIASSRQEFEAATLLDSALVSHEDIDRLRPAVHARAAANRQDQRWIKVHDAYTLNADGEPVLGRRAAAAAIYLVRDPRDVAVSFAHHTNTTIDAAIELMNAPDSALCRGRKGPAPQLRQKLLGWSGHAASWLDQTDTPVHLVRYEDLRADPAPAFAAALAFAQRRATEEELARAIRHSDFSELQRQEGEKGFAERMSRAAPFFRAGRAGGWRDALSAEQIERIEGAHAPMMRRLGYP
ncbi:MAG TPA: sulfotransferase domain-containing protein [Caulobacteraceae bacterium]|jgi:aryl sulfotransferase|nr:sulfotransferase domain-containing protein [Caulobacteraceae bacterium]